MDTKVDLLLALGFLVAGIVFRMGKGAKLALGASEEARARYREGPSLRFFSWMMFALSACCWMAVAGGVTGAPVLQGVGIVAGIVVAVGGMLYFSQSSRFRA